MAYEPVRPMIIDASAILAIVFKEPGFEGILQRIQEEDVVAAGTPTLVETGIVIHARLKDASRGLLERLLDELQILEIPFGEVHWGESVDAFRRYGKGQHPAGLNFGDCMTYAMAQLAGESLLFNGDDFGQTDVEGA